MGNRKKADLNENTPQNPNKSKQIFFAVALLILWVLIYLAAHYHILKDWNFKRIEILIGNRREKKP